MSAAFSWPEGLAAVLEARERRERARDAALREYAGRAAAEGIPFSAVQLTLAVPGRRKNGPDIERAVRLGARAFEEAAEAEAARIASRRFGGGAAGPFWLWVVEVDAREAKSLAVGLEEGCRLGRLWDFDVHDDRGTRVGRESVGADPRTCFLCGRPAAECAGRRVHDGAAVGRRFAEMLAEGMDEWRATSAEASPSGKGAATLEKRRIT